MKVLFIGLGHMGSALISGINKNKKYEIYGYDAYEPALQKAVEKLNIKPIKDLTKILGLGINNIVIGVRVPDVKNLLTSLDQLNLKNVTIISMASGVSINELESYIVDSKFEFIRIMPNINALQNLSTTAITKKNLDDKKFKEIKNMFEECGKVIEVDENDFSNYTIAASCMPAYSVLIVNEWINNAVNNGLDEKKAQKIITDVFINSLKIWNNSKKSADEFVNEIATPNGVTIEGVKILRKNGKLSKIIKKAYNAALKKDNKK